MLYGATLSPNRAGSQRVLIGLAVAMSLLVLCFVLVTGLFVIVGAALLAGAVAAAAFAKPMWAALFFVAFTPVNRVVIAATLHFTGSDLLTKLVQLWKDGLIAVLVARVLFDAAFSSAPKRVRYLDLLVAAFITLSLAYLVYPGPHDVDQFTRIQGFRTDASFLFAYFVGRGIMLHQAQVRWLLLALVPGSLVVAAVSVWQFAAPVQANEFFAALRAQDFSQLQGGQGPQEAVRERNIAGVSLARASGLLMGDLALSYFQLVLVALSAALYLETRSPARRVFAGAFLLIMLGTLVLTITRSAIAAAMPVLLVSALMARSFGRLVAVGLVGVAVALAAVAATQFQPETLHRLLDPNEASVQGHLSAAHRSLEIVRAEPIGQGLGTAGTIGQRYLGESAITNESWYLQLATEMGPASSALYLAALVLATFQAFAAYRASRDFWLRTLALGIGASGVGFLLLGNFLHAWENTVLSMLFWLYAGIVLRAGQLESSDSYRR